MQRQPRDVQIVRTPASDLAARPFMVIWEVTNACDLACRHCRAESIPDIESGTLTTAEGKCLLDQVELFGRPRPIVILSGGDPFKRGDLCELVTHGTSLGLPMAVSPSGTPLLTRASIQKIKDAGAKAISLSLDGSTPALHDSFRGVSGSFALTLNGWRSAREIGLRVQLNTTVTRLNLRDLPNVLELVEAHGAMTWSVFFLVPTGRGRLDDEVTPQQYEDVLNWLYEVGKRVSVKTTEGHHYKRVVLQRSVLDRLGVEPVTVMELGAAYADLRAASPPTEEGPPSRRPQRGGTHRTPMHINAGNGFVFVSHLGDVFPSGFMPVSAGNVREASLVDVYRDAPMFRDLRNPDEYGGKCGRCEFRYVCGGSRSRAYAVTGDPLGEEPFCTYQPGSFPYQAELQPHLHRAA